MTTMINGLFPGELVPDAVIGGCIEIYENVWPAPSETIARMEKECANPDSGVYWERASTIGNGAFQNTRTNQILGITHLSKITNNSALQNIHNQFNLLLLATSVPYATRFEISEMLYHEEYGCIKYATGTEYKSHYDSGTQMGRIISALVYLNDDYEGGELEFPSFGIKIKPKAGMLILFPSNFAYRHIAHPVKSGTKYALVTWIRDRQV